MNTAAVPHPAGAARNGTIVPPLPRRLRVHINLDTVGQNPSSQPLSNPPRPVAARHLQVKVGNTALQFPCYKVKWKPAGSRRVYTAYEFRWHDGLRRRREKRSTVAKLQARADEVGIAIVNGETARLQLTRADQASYLRARELAAATGKPIELIVSEHVEMLRLLNGRAGALDVARDYLARHPANAKPRTVPEICAEIKSKPGKKPRGAKWKRNLEHMLNAFSGHFTGPLLALQARDVDDWLDTLKNKKGGAVDLTTRANYRAIAVTVCRFAVARGYAPKDWDIMKDVSDPEPALKKIHVYTPEAFLYLLNTAEVYENKKRHATYRDMVPFMATTAFAGVRHGEMNEEKAQLLDWRDYDWAAKVIVIDREVAKGTRRKAGDDRVADMPDNLIEWLKPYIRKSGKICDRKNTADALCRLLKVAGNRALAQAAAAADQVGGAEQAKRLKQIADELLGPKKNALRKSFITYKLALTRDIASVAEGAGNSPGTIRKGYKARGHSREKETAERWFSLTPTNADILPLFGWQNRNNCSA